MASGDAFVSWHARQALVLWFAAAGVGLAVGVLSGTGTRASLAPLADIILPSAIELPGVLTARP